MKLNKELIRTIASAGSFLVGVINLILILRLR